ncbi:hypothetical protein [uncultured Apibacter sp.]|uniref:hypothetical protein n=1 Tax=uncultured Apibacter sp. TaxID=1778616 RepID=UPI0025E2FB54|nr:hypothetical protein [uncultured Apibacter sp.]
MYRHLQYCFFYICYRTAGIYAPFRRTFNCEIAPEVIGENTDVISFELLSKYFTQYTSQSEYSTRNRANSV